MHKLMHASGLGDLPFASTTSVHRSSSSEQGDQMALPPLEPLQAKCPQSDRSSCMSRTSILYS